MRIALIHTPLKASTGGERQLLRLAIELQKNGHEVEIFTNEVDYENCFPNLLNKVNITTVPYPVRTFWLYYNLFFGMMKIGKEVLRGGFDLVNNHNFPTEWAIYFIKKYSHIPSVWMCNEPPFWFFHKQERKRFNNLIDWPLFEIFDRISVNTIDGIVVLSRLIGKIVKKIYKRDFFVVRSGLDIKDFEMLSGNKFKKEYGIENDFILLQVGTIIDYKRQEDSIKALNILSKKYDNLKLIFIGPENKKYKEKLINLIIKYKLESNVLFLGPVSDTTLKQAYAASDVFLFPAFQPSWSLAVVEAMASRKPVIVSNMCGVSEIIKNNINGFVICHGNYKMLAQYIELLINNKSIKKRIGKTAYKFVKKNLSWKKYTENMERIFEYVVK